MSAHRLVVTGGPMFDGTALHTDRDARFEDGIFTGYASAGNTNGAERIDLAGDILSPGYVDLQVNGGDGILFNDDPSVATLTRIAAAHRVLGATRILPTLITDTAEKTRAAIAAVQGAIARGVRGIAGLHLEGPHLSVARKGAHDARYIRPMTEVDLQMLLDAKAKLPVLMVTVAPESVSLDQVTALAEAGILVSLGHTDADFDTCTTYARAGACCATHLFNAMSQLNNRDPGLVGAALHCGTFSAGLIADGIHVHPASMRAAWASKARPGRIFLVSDAMAVAGTDMDSFTLDGREITRSDGRLTLADGTLAGADLDLTRAVSVLVNSVAIPVTDALAAATSIPAELCKMPTPRITAGQTKLDSLIRIRADLTGVTPLGTS